MMPMLPDMPAFPPGEVWLAGAGPGDPRLLTLLALHALQQADDIVHDALVDPRVLALGRVDAERIAAGKRGGRPSARQPDINDLLVDRARLGRRVLRLKGGDPFVFGRGWDEVAALVAAGIRCRVIPGLTAGLAGPSLAGIPATTRDTGGAVVLAADLRRADGSSAIDWTALARLGQPVVLYMATAHLAEIAEALMAGGLPPETPAALIQSAATPHQRVLDSRLDRLAGEAAAQGFGSPSIAVIGAVAGLRALVGDGLGDFS